MLRIICPLVCLFCSLYAAGQPANRNDVVIDEIMADPTPAVGLPGSEWVELRNTASFTINLSGWRLGDAAGQSGPMPAYNLKPDSMVIVCTGSAVAALSVYGPVISVTSFPSLDNTGDVLFLRTPQNKIIHAVGYDDTWYKNELKKDGGWTLEMIDSRNGCTGYSNWRASNDLSGGTPGRKNSVDALNADQAAPRLLRAYAADSVNISLLFDEPMDSLRLATTANYTISDGIGTPISAAALQPLFDRVNLRLATALQRGRVYTITAAAVTDCAGNAVGSSRTARVGISQAADSLDIVVNEILFNPKSGGTDYVELYNRSNRIADLKQLYIANRNSTGVVSSIRQLSADNYLLFPGDYLVVTEDPALVKAQYITLNPDAFITVSSMPSFNDDEGNVIVLNAQGRIADELKYTEKWHFKLIDNREGISLERIDYNAATQNAANWHSAATSAGYGTPGYKNSQYLADAGVTGDITLLPEIVSPDNDGQDDFATLSYSFPEPGYTASITIFDAAGRPVRYLQRNALCGIKGSFRWDGLSDKGLQLPTGIYVVFTEVFNLKGRTRKYKNTIVVARRS